MRQARVTRPPAAHSPIGQMAVGMLNLFLSGWSVAVSLLPSAAITVVAGRAIGKPGTLDLCRVRSGTGGAHLPRDAHVCQGGVPTRARTFLERGSVAPVVSGE